MQILLPPKVDKIIETLMNAGYEAYAVGGCVRDSLLSVIPSDWDITTSAAPEQTKTLFKRTIDTGIKHGTITVLWEKESFEITTYRIDGEYEDGRHPKRVAFTSSLTEDLKRRDFTINAMAYNKQDGLVDIFGGLSDLENKIIRCVGNPEERFSEDALRIMRAIRFCAQLGYTIEDKTKAAIKKLASQLKNISAERIQTELVKLVTSPNPYVLKAAYEMGITKVIMPEFDAMMTTEQNNPHHEYVVGEHSLYAMEYIKNDKVLRLTMLFHDMGKPQVMSQDRQGIHHFYGHENMSKEIAGRILKRLRFDNDTIYKVCTLVKWHDYIIEPTKRHVRRAINKIGEDIFPLLFLVKEADLYAQSEYLREEKLRMIQEIKVLYNKIIEDRDCISLKTLAVTGADLIEAGVDQGKEIGVLLRAMLYIVIENPEYNNKEYLLQQVNILSPKKS